MSYKGDSLREPMLRASEQLRQRGPDGFGVLESGPATLVHRRLAVIDPTERASQPMSTPGGQFAITFNGEIYNFKERRSTLRDWRFRTESDTEVLIATLATLGINGLRDLRGMYAFVAWNANDQELVAARDPYGIKPLYYAQTTRGILFASTCKALLATGLVSTEVDPVGEACFWRTGSVAEPRTWWSSIRAVPAGHYVRVGPDQVVNVEPFQQVRECFERPARYATTSLLRERVAAAVNDSVRAHTVADVPVSVLLSGGIDSGTIAGLAAQYIPTTGITVSFDRFAGTGDDETRGARLSGERFGIAHRIRTVSQEEFVADMPKILADMDQPSIDGVNTWYAAKAVAESGHKVALSGVGGDEIFHGYAHFRAIPRLMRAYSTAQRLPGGSTLGRAAMRIQAWRTGNEKWREAPWALNNYADALALRRGLFPRDDIPALMSAPRALLAADEEETPPGVSPQWSSARSLSYLESTQYLRNQLLRDADWASMAHGVELRTPLVDIALIGTLAPYVEALGAGRSKALLAAAAPNGLPNYVRNRVKTGFSIPIVPWLASQGVKAQSGHPTKAWAQYVAASFTQ